jgi:hypothetical protein
MGLREVGGACLRLVSVWKDECLRQNLVVRAERKRWRSLC